MRNRLLLLLREALQPSKYREWSLKNGERVHRDWATQAHLYSKYFLPISSKEELERVKDIIYSKLDDNQKLAFNTFYVYKQDVLDGILGESELPF